MADKAHSLPGVLVKVNDLDRTLAVNMTGFHQRHLSGRNLFANDKFPKSATIATIPLMAVILALGPTFP
jgi:hypothetical protein